MKREEQLALKKVEYEGKVYPSNSYGDVVVLEYINSKDITIRFLNTGNNRKVSISELNKGEIRDNEAFPVYKVGVMDIPNELNSETGKPKEYLIWNAIRQRCYNENTRDRSPTYKDVDMSENFKLYSYFKGWCKNQIGFNKDGFEIDKDILVKGNRTYSENTCCFVPKELNTLFTHRRKDKGLYPVGVSYKPSINRYIAQISKYKKVIHLGCFNTSEEAFYVYKEAKEQHITEVANKWKDQIDPRVYEALMNWTISIDD